MSNDTIPRPMVFMCSGAADVGEVADRAARELARHQEASLCCAAAVAAGDPGILDAARAATVRVVIDGCGKRCAARILAEKSLAATCPVCLEELGMVKGKTPANAANVADAVQYTRDRLACMQAGGAS